MFITSKPWNNSHQPRLVRGAGETTLKNLKTTCLDRHLIHWPRAYKEEIYGKAYKPKKVIEHLPEKKLKLKN